ncbi:hypothetical protein [Nocardia huaxiensis]|uniref:hypothetical protein n=1 Tax=Nocardia huaxiensis TaxID=2755382 RepID=UPI001E4840FD|nr:hypothetical protein [Nocardia huaxiensis]UFS94251.1 hypothetical protein LPY97_26250 [Nocardia huaxiensis]
MIVVDESTIGLGAGDPSAWITIGGGPESTALWAGYGKHTALDVNVNSQISGRYNPDHDVDDILTEGKEGLTWFNLVRDRYKLTGRAAPADVPALTSANGMNELYYKQDGMHVDRLFGAGQRIEATLPRISQARDAHQQATQQLSGAWQGESGEGARTKLGKLSTWSDDAYEGLASLPGTIGGAVHGVKTCVQRKADAFKKLAGVHRINGVDMTNSDSGGEGINNRNSDDAASNNDDVSLIILYAARRGIGDDARERIKALAESGIFGPVTLPRYSTSLRGSETNSKGAVGPTVFDNAVQPLCERWRQEFCESAEGYFRAYSGLCKSTDTAVEQYLQVAIDALNEVGSMDQPPAPEGNPANPGYVSPGTTSPGGTSPGGTSPVDTTAAGVNPVVTAPTDGNPVTNNPNTGNPVTTNPSTANVSTVLSGLSSLLSKGAETVQSASTALQSLTTQNTTGATTTTGTGTTTNPVSFTLGGSTLSLAQTSAGALTATLTGADGKAQKYTLGIKDGLPYLTYDATSNTDGEDTETAPAATNSQETAAAGVSGSADTSTSSVSTSAASSSGMTMGTMPAMGGMGAAGGGGGSAEPEHHPSSIAPPKPLWDTKSDQKDEALRTPVGRDVDTGEMPFDITVEAPAAVEPVSRPAPAVRTDGVKIEIDMGGR